MGLSTPEQEARQRRREERLLREQARRRIQRAALVVVAALLLTAAVWGVVASALSRSGGEPTTAGTTPTRSSSASATTTPRSSTSNEATPSKPATETASRPSTATSAAASATHTIEPLVPAPGKKTIVVSKKKQLVTLYKADGTPVDRYRCASGVIYPRVGTYKIFGKRKQSWSLYDDTTFFYFTKFEVSDKGNSIGFHSIPQEPDGSLVGGLGKPVSHGCVRLAKKNAKFLYEWAPIGTKVIVKK